MSACFEDIRTTGVADAVLGDPVGVIVDVEGGGVVAGVFGPSDVTVG